MIATLLNFRVKTEDGRVIGFWFPLFILWLILLPLLAVPAPLILLFSLILWKKVYGRLILFSYFAIFSFICNLSGLNLDIQSEDKNMIYINLL